MIDVEPDMTRAMKTFNRVSRYGTAIGRVMVHEATFLDWQRVERLLESDFDGGVAVLADTEYFRYLEGASTAAGIEEGLLSMLHDQYRLLDDMAPDGFLSEFLHLKYDFHNVKTVLKSRYVGVGGERPLPGLGSIAVERLEASLAVPGAGNLPAYWEGALRTLGAAYDSGAGPDLAAAMADRMYLERRLALASSIKSRGLVDYARAAIDLVNLKVLLRGRRLGREPGYLEAALARGGRLGRSELSRLAPETFEGLSSRLLATRYGRILERALSPEDKKIRLTSFDRESEEFLLGKLSGMKRMSLGPERIVAYMLRREDEVALLRVIFFSKFYHLSTDAVARTLSPGPVAGGPGR